MFLLLILSLVVWIINIALELEIFNLDCDVGRGLIDLVIEQAL